MNQSNENKLEKLLAIKELVASLIEEGSIGTIGERNNNGADSYMCPSCYATEYIKGNCCFNSYLGEVEHKEDCELMKLKSLIDEMEEE